MQRFLLFATQFLFLGLILLGCSREKTVAELGAEEEFKLAKQKFEEKDYDKAIEGFKRVVFRYPGSKWAEEAQYRLAKSSFLKRDYEQAEIEYDFFIRSYPRSRFADDASFELAKCYFERSPPYYLDQPLTKRAVREFRAFIKKYPDSERLDEAKEYEQKCIDKLVRKELEAAKLYIKMDKYESAVLYLKDIQKNYPENSYSKEISALLEECEKELGTP